MVKEAVGLDGWLADCSKPCLLGAGAWALPRVGSLWLVRGSGGRDR